MIKNDPTKKCQAGVTNVNSVMFLDILLPNNSPIDFLLGLKGQYQFSIFINNINMATVIITSYTLQSFCLISQHAVKLDAFLSTTI